MYVVEQGCCDDTNEVVEDDDCVEIPVAVALLVVVEL